MEQWQGGAEISQPYSKKIVGAVCYAGAGQMEGSAFFRFPADDKRLLLAFVIGPRAPQQENNPAFTGPGKYSNIGISIKNDDGSSDTDFGQVVVNDDGQTGTFTLGASDDQEEDKDGKQIQQKKAPKDPNKQTDESTVTGTFNCGHKIKRD
jgi:hypothetical protein